MNYDEFKDHFNILSDSRQERKITYNFFEVMFQVVTAMLCGMKTWDEIEAFGEENQGKIMSVPWSTEVDLRLTIRA